MKIEKIKILSGVGGEEVILGEFKYIGLKIDGKNIHPRNSEEFNCQRNGNSSCIFNWGILIHLYTHV